MGPLKYCDLRCTPPSSPVQASCLPNADVQTLRQLGKHNVLLLLA